MTSLAIWAQSHLDIRRHTLQGFQFGEYFSDKHYGFRHDSFNQNETCGFKKFEQVLSDDVYCTVPEALAHSYGVLASPAVTTNE